LESALKIEETEGQEGKELNLYETWGYPAGRNKHGMLAQERSYRVQRQFLKKKLRGGGEK